MFGIENFESKETEMKKKLLLMGLVSVLLMAGMMFTACGGDDDDGGGGGVSAPKLGDLPDLPADTGAGLAYVATDAEAKYLLSSESFRYALWSAEDAAEELIKAKAKVDANGRSWEVGPDDKTKIGFIINSKGKETSKGVDIWDVDENYKPKVGESSEMSSSEETTIEFIANTTGPVTIYSGSKIASKGDGSQSMKITAINETSHTVTLTASGSSSRSYAYGLTVSFNGKGAKIILEAKITIPKTTLEITIPGNDDDEPDVTKYSGVLKVYGTNNKIVYEKAIDSEKAFDEVSEYFGI
jgi:hypothetical protein